MRLQLLLLALGVRVFAEPKPNSQIRIHTSAFKFLTQATCQILKTEVAKRMNNFISFNTTMGPGEIILNTSLSVDQFVCPSLDSYLSDKDGIHFTSRKGVWKMKGLYKVVYRNPFGIPYEATSNGDAVLTATDLDADLISRIVIGADKHPQLQISECKAQLGAFDYKFNGKLSDLPNMFNELVGVIVKNLISELLCQITQNTILTRFNEVIDNIPLHYEVGDNFTLDWALYDPKYTTNLVEMKGAAKLGYGPAPCESHVTYIEEFPEFTSGESAKDVVIWLGQSLSACALKSMHESHFLKIPINIDTLPDYKDELKTSCGWTVFKGNCIGAALSGLRGVGEYADLLLYTHEAPEINFKNGVIGINAKFALEVHEYPKKQHPQVLGILIIGVSANVKPKIVDKRLIGDCDSDDIKPEISFVEGYKIKEFAFGYEWFLTGIIKKVSKVLFFGLLEAGLPLPSFDGAGVSDKTLVEVFDKVVRINMGLEVNGN